MFRGRGLGFRPSLGLCRGCIGSKDTAILENQRETWNIYGKLDLETGILFGYSKGSSMQYIRLK